MNWCLFRHSLKIVKHFKEILKLWTKILLAWLLHFQNIAFTVNDWSGSKSYKILAQVPGTLAVYNQKEFQIKFERCKTNEWHFFTFSFIDTSSKVIKIIHCQECNQRVKDFSESFFWFMQELRQIIQCLL